MSRLTEKEVFDRMRQSLKEAIADAEALARGERGPIYPRFRENIDLIYGCTRQIGAGFRGDARWLRFGLELHQCRERTRRWLVERWGPKCYRMLAERLRWAEARAIELETKRTGRRGMILPTPLPAPTRTEGRSILVPAGFRDIRG